MDDGALQAIYPVFSALVVATVLRVFVFAHVRVAGYDLRVHEAVAADA